MNKIKQSILAIVIGLALAGGVSWAQTYKNPGCNPPECNTPTPINVGIENQTKGGGVFLTSPFGGINVNGVANFSGLSQFNNTATFFAGIKIPTGAGVNKVLTSDKDGFASWQAPAVSSSYSPMIDIKSKTCSPSSADCEVTCISGYTLVSGGFKGEKQMASYPTNDNSWRTIAWDYSGSNDTTIYVVCIKK